MNHYTITDFGAQPDLQEIQTAKIQACIEHCRQAGGGKVIIPAGTFVIGSLRLYSNITLYLQADAKLLGAQDYRTYQDFSVPSTIRYLKDPYYIEKWHLPRYYFYGMITAFNEENIQIIGEPGSVIDGRDVYDENGEEGFRGPMGIIMSQVKNLSLSGYCFQNSANWSHTLDGCDGIAIHDVTIKGGHDGFNLHHSRNITIADCHLECGDDCFAGYDILHLNIKNCFLNTACNGFRVGGEDITVNDCRLIGPGHYPHLSEDTYYTHAAFKYYSLAADKISVQQTNMVFKNCVLTDAQKLISYEGGSRELLQDNKPLQELVIDSCEIANLHNSSICKGNGEAIQLHIRDSRITCELEEPFLILDEAAQLTLEQVTFPHPVTIQKGTEVISLSGTIVRLVV